MSGVAKRLDGLRCRLVQRQVSAQATLCSMGTHLPPEKRAQHPPHPIFVPCLLWRNSWMDQDGTWYRGDFGPGDIVLDGVAAPTKRGHSPQFLVHLCCSQTAGWMKTPLGMEVDLGPGHFVLDGDPAPPREGHSSPPPSFRPLSFVATIAHLSCC